MNASVFILPTSGPRTYRGKYPARPRSVSHGETGLHVELNDGTRLWTAKAAELPKLADDCSAMLARAVPMTAEQYETLKAAAELLRTRAGIAGHGRRAELEARVRAMVESIKADDSQYAKRNAEAARRETLAGGTGRGFDPARPFRVRNKTPQFSGSFDFATLERQREAERKERETATTVRANLRRQAEGMAEIAKAEQRGAIAETVSTIDMTPTWAGILPSLRALIENSNAEGRRTAWAELERMAALADERNAMAARLASDAA